MKKKIHIWYPYPTGIAPSQRFRIEQYLPELKKQFDVAIYPFWSKSAWHTLYQKGKFLPKVGHLLAGFARRFISLIHARRADFIYIHREAAPIGPPIFEWLVSKVLKKKIIYDFDDAIWLPNQSDANRKWVRFTKTHTKVKRICQWSYKVSVCNSYLRRFVMNVNPRVLILPTTIDMDYHLNISNLKSQDSLPVIGWTGSHSTLKHLEHIWDILNELHVRIPFEFHLISDYFPDQLPTYVHCVPWNQSTEIQDLQSFDIGIMPLSDTPWEAGKCGFKLLQYLALEIPAVASDVGVNSDIIQPEETGYLIQDNRMDQWLESLSMLLTNKELRHKMGKAGREHIQNHYSVESQKSKVITLFN